MQEREIRSRNKLDGEVRDEVELGLGLTLSTKKQKQCSERGKSKDWKKTRTADKVPSLSNIEKEMLAKSLLDQSTERERKI